MLKKTTFFFLLVLFTLGVSFPQNPADAEDFEDFLNELQPDFLEGEGEAENPEFSQGLGKFNPEIQRPLTICMAAGHLDLNPHTSSYSTESQVINALQEGLFCYDPKTLDPLPALASDYRISRDKKRWTFTIRDNAKTSDGLQITPQTVIDSWLRLQKTPDAPYASLLDCIRGIKEYREGKIGQEEVGLKANGQKLTVTLNNPTAHLPRILCHHAFSVFTGNMESFSGAYVLKTREENTLVLEKNENYWDSQNVAVGQIVIEISEDKSENTWLFNTGRADWLISSFDINSLLNKDAVRISAVFGTTYLFFTCKNPVWNDADFRNALLAAVPWGKLRSDNLIQATTLVYPLSGYPEVEGLYEISEEEALELMEDARKKAGIAPDKKLQLTFGIADNDYMKGLARILMEAWEPLGVELVTFKISEDQYLSNIPYLNYDLFSYSWIGDFADPLAFLELFREGSTLNQTKWTNPKFTEKLLQAAEETDEKERYRLLGKAEQILLDDGVIMPVSHSISLHAVNPTELGGWYTNALDIHPLKNLYFRETKYEMPDNVAFYLWQDASRIF